MDFCAQVGGIYFKNQVSWIWRELFRLVHKWKQRYVNPHYAGNRCKVRTFWETHKIWKNHPYGFDKSADLLSKRQNHMEDFSSYVCFSKSLNFKSWIIASRYFFCTQFPFHSLFCPWNIFKSRIAEIFITAGQPKTSPNLEWLTAWLI